MTIDLDPVMTTAVSLFPYHAVLQGLRVKEDLSVPKVFKEGKALRDLVVLADQQVVLVLKAHQDVPDPKENGDTEGIRVVPVQPDHKEMLDLQVRWVWWGLLVQ